MEEQQNNKPPTPPTPPTPPAETEQSKLPKGLFAELKKSLLAGAPQVAGKVKGEFISDPKYVERVNALKPSECDIASSKGKVFVVNAGPFGLRKVGID